MSQNVSTREVLNSKMHHVLRDFLTFRVWFDFKSGKKRHIMGREWGGVSVSQLLHHRVPHIVLDKDAGYKDCLGMAEKFNRHYNIAKIYSGRYPHYNTLHRVYKFGDPEPQDVQDPVITDEERIRILQFRTDGSNILVAGASDKYLQQIADTSSMDFKTLIQKQLKV